MPFKKGYSTQETLKRHKEWEEKIKNGSEDGWFVPRFSHVDNKDFAFVIAMDSMLRKERNEALSIAQSIEYGTEVGEYRDFIDIPGEEFFESLALNGVISKLYAPVPERRICSSRRNGKIPMPLVESEKEEDVDPLSQEWKSMEIYFAV